MLHFGVRVRTTVGFKMVESCADVALWAPGGIEVGQFARYELCGFCTTTWCSSAELERCPSCHSRRPPITRLFESLILFDHRSREERFILSASHSTTSITRLELNRASGSLLGYYRICILWQGVGKIRRRVQQQRWHPYVYQDTSDREFG